MFREWVIFDGLMYKECNFSLYTCIQENRWSSQCISTWKHERIFKKEDKKKQWKETKHSHVWSLRPSRQIVFKSSLFVCLSVCLFSEECGQMGLTSNVQHQVSLDRLSVSRDREKYHRFFDSIGNRMTTASNQWASHGQAAIEQQKQIEEFKRNKKKEEKRWRMW